MKFTYGGKPIKTIDYPIEPAKPGDKSPLARGSKVIIKHIAAIIGILIVAFGINLVMPAQTRPQPVSASDISDKYDGDCPQPYTTVGRCADKCPNQTDTLLGYDPTTGAAICKAAPTGCPYGESIPLGPECAKHATDPANQPPATQPATTTPSNQCGGTK
jgi:hypothetical protein